MFGNAYTIVLPISGMMGTVNVYLFVGDGLTLVDTGSKRDDTLTALRAGLAEHGFILADIERVVITHAHTDHFGLAAHIAAESGAQVWAHQNSVDWLTEFDIEQRRNNAFLWNALRQGGIPEEALAARMAQRESEEKAAKAVSVDVLMEDGEFLSLGGSTWEVVHLPGHAADLICLYHHQTGTFISSDHLLPDIPSAPLLQLPPRGTDRRPCSMISYLASLRRMAGLDISTILPSHGQPVDDHRTLIAQRLAFHRERAEWMATPLEEGEKTAYQIWMALFPRLWPLDPFVGVAEVVSHLDIFEAERSVGTLEREALIYYRMTAADSSGDSMAG
jgi:glyoxylase-like metal-dependent hydrolase (beta-lactamase superfamily II)